MEVINTKIAYTVEVEDLDTSKQYFAHLWDKESGHIEETEGVVENHSGLNLVVFTFAPEQTEKFEHGKILTLEIYNSVHVAIWYKDRFARVRNTSVTLDNNE